MWLFAWQLKVHIHETLMHIAAKYLKFNMYKFTGDQDNIREWAMHHIGLGIGRLYIYDDLSIPPLRPYLIGRA